MNDKLYSIIAIFYNKEQYVRQCIDSLINQTYRNIEIILVDDGSKDSTGMICDEYAEKDSRIIVIHKENGGISSSRNIGISKARGEYFFLVDGDDYISENGIEQFHKIITSCKTQVDYVFGKMSYFYNETGEVYCVQNNIQDLDFFELDGKNTFIKMFETNGCVSMGCRGAFRRTFYLDNHILFPNCYYEDIDVIMRVLLKAKNVSVNTQDYYFFRDSKDSTSKKSQFKYIVDIIQEMNQWNEYLKECSEERFVDTVKKEISRRTTFQVVKYIKALKWLEIPNIVKLVRDNPHLYVGGGTNRDYYFQSNIVGAFLIKSNLIYIHKLLRVTIRRLRKILHKYCIKYIIR